MRTLFTILLSCFLIFFFTSPLIAQWIKQNSGTTQSLYAVSFTDANMGTVVGDAGTILRTTNGGTTWTPQSSGTTSILTGVSFTDANNGTVVGDSGTILRTTNGGTTWTRQSSGTTSILAGVSFTDANNGTVVGGGGDFRHYSPTPGIILHTTNGGATWIKQFESDTVMLWAVSFTDSYIGTVVGGCQNNYIGSFNIILHTTDGGVTWVNQSGLSYNFLLGVSFINGMIGTAVGKSVDFGNSDILRTTDGGITWIIQYTLRGVSFGGVCFIDTDNGTAVGNNQSPGMPRGNIFRTTNGGSSWINQSSGTTNYLQAVCLTDANTGTVVGNSGTILRTINGGTLVENQYDVPKKYLLNQNFPNPFNPVTTIEYQIPKNNHVILKVFDLLGREIATLVNEQKPAGTYTIQFDGSGLASGIYFYRLQAGTYINTKKFVLLK